MILLPFTQTVECPACKCLFETERRIGVFRYCEVECKPIRDPSRWLDVTSMSDAGTPHLHVTCPHCSFEFLMTPALPTACVEWRYGK